MTTTQAPLSTYATIDMHSGYVWWTGQAASALDACKASDVEYGSFDDVREYLEVTLSERGSASFAVYAIPADLVIDDGQDEEQIAAVEACQLVAYVKAA